MAVLYVAVQRGQKKYKSSKANLAVRWQFESTTRLLELINDPDKMDREVNILNGSIGGPPPVTERSRLNDFPGVIGDDIAYGIGAATTKDEKKIYQLNGIKRIIARNFGTGQEAHDFFVSIQSSKIGVINNFYTQPNKFINAVYFSKSKPAWNPVRIPIDELQRKPSKQNDAERSGSTSSNANNQAGTTSNNTPSKQTKVDSAKAIHKPNTVINLDTSKLLLMPNNVAVKYLLEQLKPYLNEHYGHYDKFSKLLEGKEKEEIARLILSEGELERLAGDNRIYPTSRAQTPSDRDKLKTNPVAYSYVIQYAKENATGKSANDLLMELYRMLHPIINSFHCHLGLEPMHDASEETTIFEPDVMYGILDDTFTSNITKEKYKDMLQFRFRIVTEADIINLLSHVKDFTVDGSKPLSTWLKERKIHLHILWKSPPSFEEVKMLVGATKFSSSIMVVKELNEWLLEQNVECESSQLRVKWRNRGGRNVLILSTDPSIKQAVRELLEQRTGPVNPVIYHETYDYKFFSPSDEEDEASFNRGIEMHIEYCKQLMHVQFKGVKDDLYTATPNLTKVNWVDDSTISQILLGKDEPLFSQLTRSHSSLLS